ncbi:oligosaccharide flippase family protein [Streptococcus porcinus]|uniref:Oligosaccharide flippase family protein n=1 Tax=Streptococcus porcinus TaxID=1340 RepID=A0A7V9WT52_STRPO|nr:oligosaccharide flippase family protein [Streptococcus porcinus]MBA2796617.1 oligosaccharide flippase family protein [Streptococcus porcinus]
MKTFIRMPFRDSFYKDLFVTLLGQVLTMAVTFLLNKVISNQYSIHDFGTYNLIKRAVSIISFVMLMAMGIAIPKYVSEAQELKNDHLKESYMVSSLFLILFSFICLTIPILIFKNQISFFIFGSYKLTQFVLPVCLYALSAGLVTYVYSFYRGVNDFIKYNIVALNLQILTLVIVFFVKDNLLLLHYLWSFVIFVYAIFEIFKLFVTNHFNFSNIKYKLQTVRTLFEYGFPRVAGDFVLFAFNLAPVIIVNNKFGSIQVAYFSAALSINALLTPLFSLVGTILLPFVSKSIVNNSISDMKQKINILGIIYIFVSLLAIIMVYIFGEKLLFLLFNKDYVKSIEIVKISILSVLPNAFYLLLRSPLDGISKFPYNTFCLVMSFTLYFILLIIAPDIKMVAYSAVVAYSLLGILSLLCWQKALKVKDK